MLPNIHQYDAVNPATPRDLLLLNSILHPRGYQIALSPTRLVEIFLSQAVMEPQSLLWVSHK